MNKSAEYLPGNHEHVAKQLSKIIPVHLTNQTGNTFCKFLSKILPIYSCNQKIQGIHKGINTSSYSTS